MTPKDFKPKYIHAEQVEFLKKFSPHQCWTFVYTSAKNKRRAKRGLPSRMVYDVHVSINECREWLDIADINGNTHPCIPQLISSMGGVEKFIEKCTPTTMNFDKWQDARINPKKKRPRIKKMAIKINTCDFNNK